MTALFEVRGLTRAYTTGRRSVLALQPPAGDFPPARNQRQFRRIPAGTAKPAAPPHQLANLPEQVETLFRAANRVVGRAPEKIQYLRRDLLELTADIGREADLV